MKKSIFPFILIFLIFLAFPCAAAQKGAGKISDLSGDVSIRDKDNVPYKTTQKGAVFDKGYWIKTGADGWTILSLNDGSKLTLSNNTELEITEFVIGENKKEGIFRMTQGKLRAFVIKLANEQVDYKVKSPTAVAGIKGTEFLMMTQGFANVFFGNDGQTEISGATVQTKSLTINTFVQNTRGYTPTEPIPVEPNTPISMAKKNFEQITAVRPPIDWELSNNLPHIIARWNINYGHYLADAGKYEEALYIFQIALDLTHLPDIRSDARLERGAVYGRFLKNPEAALAEYLLVLEEYPQVLQRETALYLTGMTLYELGFTEQAKTRLHQYRKQYPSGRYINNVRTIMNMLEKQ